MRELMMSEYQSATAAEKVAPVEKQVDNDIEFREKPVYEVFKRIFDIVCSLLALVVFSPLILIVSLIICIKDFGSPFYIQDRIKKDEKHFKLYKFRSMYKHSDELQDKLKQENGVDDISLKLENDPRIINGLKFIRDYSIDELMQLINVLKGDMTIIGPRPLPAYEYEEIKNIEKYKLRFKVKQGLSCYWQIYRTKDTSFDERMEMDNKYVLERSFLTDLKIIFKTIGVVLKGNNY